MDYFYENKTLIPIRSSLKKDTSETTSPNLLLFHNFPSPLTQTYVTVFLERYLYSLQIQGNTQSDVIQVQPTGELTGVTYRCVGDSSLKNLGNWGKQPHQKNSAR